MIEREVVIFGGKGTAVNVAEQIEHARRVYGYPMKVVGFAIDDASLGPEIASLPVVSGVMGAWQKYRQTAVEFIFALFRPDVMAERMALLRQLGIPASRFANFIHPTAYVSPSVTLGYGNVVMSHTSLHHRVSLGSFNIVNANVVIEHETAIEDGVFLAASACIGARTKIGAGTFVGLNATIREDVRIAGYSFVGMGACVLDHIETPSVVFGVPAKARQ